MPVMKIAVRPRGAVTRSQGGAIGDADDLHYTGSTGSSPMSSNPGTPENCYPPTSLPSNRPMNDRCQRVQSASSRRCASPNILTDVTSLQAKRLKELYKRLSVDEESDSDDEDNSQHLQNTNCSGSIATTLPKQKSTKRGSGSHGNSKNTEYASSSSSTKSTRRAPGATSTTLPSFPPATTASTKQRVVPGEVCGGRNKGPIKAKPLKGNWVS